VPEHWEKRKADEDVAAQSARSCQELRSARNTSRSSVGIFVMLRE
jgi:hypothetical protein